MRVFITKEIVNDGVLLLREEGVEVVIYDQSTQLTQEKLYEEAAKSDAILTMLSDRVDRDFLRENKHLKVISNYAVGYNNIDVVAASEYGIRIGNTPDVLTEATADLAFALLMNVSRLIRDSMQSIEDGNWKGWEPLGFIGQSLRGKTLGIFGAGRIGQCLARTCKSAFDMNIIYTSRTDKPEFDATRVSVQELLKRSDVISVHCNLNEETEGIFNYSAFKKMKPSAIFINTARGEVHNERDLVRALKESIIWGAGLDVTNPEPMSKESELLTLKNVVVTPHIGSATQSARAQMSVLAAQNILKGLKGEELSAGVN